MDGEANPGMARKRQFSMQVPNPCLPMTASRQVPLCGRCQDGQIVPRHCLQ